MNQIVSINQSLRQSVMSVNDSRKAQRHAPPPAVSFAAMPLTDSVQLSRRPVQALPATRFSGVQPYQYQEVKHPFNMLLSKASASPNHPLFTVASTLDYPYNLNFPLIHKPLPKSLQRALGVKTPSTEDKTVTYGQFLLNVRKTAEYLRQTHDIRKGDTIAFIESNSEEFLTFFYAAMLLGAKSALINTSALIGGTPERAKARLFHMINVSNCKLLVMGKSICNNPDLYSKLSRLKLLPKVQKYLETHPRALSMLESSKKGQKILATLNSVPKRMQVLAFDKPGKMEAILETEPIMFPYLQRPQSFPADETSLIFYTSGTMGFPKGVPKTNSQLTYGVESLESIMRPFNARNDKMFLMLPTSHIFAAMSFLATAQEGIPSVLAPSTVIALKNPEATLEAIAKHRANIIPLIPELSRSLIMKKPDKALPEASETINPLAIEKLKDVKQLIVGGAAISQELYDKLKEVNPNMVISPGYGSTENGIVTFNHAGTIAHVGSLLDPKHQAVRLVDVDQNGVGVLEAYSPANSDYYLGANGEIDRSRFKDGWFDTEDLATVDSQGNLRIIGRKGNSGKIFETGEYAQPSEVDEALEAYLKGRVKKALTVVVPYPKDSQKLQYVSIVLLPQNSRETESTLKAQLQALVNRGSGLQKKYVPQFILPLYQDAFPARFVSAIGKLLPGDAKEWLNSLQDKGIIELTEQNGQKQIRILNQSAFLSNCN